jgi:hypothetical protein
MLGYWSDGCAVARWGHAREWVEDLRQRPESGGMIDVKTKQVIYSLIKCTLKCEVAHGRKSLGTCTVHESAARFPRFKRHQSNASYLNMPYHSRHLPELTRVD